MQLNKTQIRTLIQKFNQLYITYRQQHIEQYTREDGSSSYKHNHYTLHDGVIEQHLKEERTVGIFAGKAGGLTKTLIFDVDKGDTLEEAQHATERLIELLNSYYAIPLEQIHTHYSGNKGYHVTLFLDKTVPYQQLEGFYREAIANLGYKESEIEFRPTSTQGVKLPLSIHRATGHYQNFMRYVPEGRAIIPLSKEESINYFQQIEPTDTEDFIELIIDELDLEEIEDVMRVDTIDAREYHRVTEGVNTAGRTRESQFKAITDVFNSGHLLYPSTRNNFTYNGLRFLKYQGNDLETSVDAVKEVIYNTMTNPDTRELISKSTSLDEALGEVDRVAKYVFTNDYRFTFRRRDVYITKEELLEIVRLPIGLHLKRILFSLLIHSKRYADAEGHFFMTYKMLYEEYGVGKNRTRLLQYLKELEGYKKILIISRNELDTTRTRLEGKPINKANTYKIAMDSYDKESTQRMKITEDTTLTLELAASHLLEEEEVKENVSYYNYRTHFKELYAI